MIHVLNYEENIIEDLSFKQDAIYEAEHNLNVQDMMETFDFTVASKIAGNLRDRNRIIIQDHMGIYREFIVEMITDLEDGTTEIQSNASYLNDITTAKPLKPKKFTNEMPTVILDYILADTGWEVADDSEVPGDFTIEWDKVIDRAEALKILQEETDMRLTYFIEISGNKVDKRYVSIKKVDPLFNGEEIVYEDNLIGLKREIDFSEVATALLGVGPEESDDDNKEKERLYVEVVDDKAQEQFGLPQRYIWDYYEVPTESDEKVTEKLLRQRTKKELDERKKASVVYEVSSNAINAQAGDMIRVKDEHIVPEIYLEAEIIEINYDLLSKTKEYKFGILREFTRDQVYRQFNKFREELEKRLKDAVSNTDSIISERLEEELKYVERYIEKSPTPPLKPKEGQLWLDTSHDGVAVLKRYENGEWIKSSVSDVKEIGGMTREETMYEALKERSARNEVNYSEVFKRHGALVSEKHYHYVDEDIKNDLTSRYNALQQSYDDFKQAFNNINAEQPTIGLITTAISRAVEFEARLKEYNDSYYVARKSFDEVIGVLQSQYSDEKFNDAMEEVASAIGGTFDGTNIIADIPNQEELKQLNEEIKAYLNGEIDSLDGKLGKQIETVVNQAKDEFSVAIDSVEKKVDGIEVGNRNLVIDGHESRSVKDNVPNGRQQLLQQGAYALSESIGGYQNYSIAIKARGTGTLRPYFAGTYLVGEFELTDDYQIFTNTRSTSSPLVKGINIYGIDVEEYDIEWIKVVKGNTVTKDFVPAPEVSENNINNLTQEVTKNTTSLNVLENEISLKADSDTVKQMLDSELNAVKSSVQTSQAELKVLSNQLSSKVEKSEYTTDMNGITRDISNTKSEINQLSDSINSKITSVEQKFDELEVGGRNYLLDSKELKNVGGRASNITTRINEYGHLEMTSSSDTGGYASGLGIVLSPNQDFKVGDTVTISIKVKSKDATGLPSLYLGTGMGYLKFSGEVKEEWTTITQTRTWKLSDIFIPHLLIKNKGTYEFKEIKLEKGTIATDWTPAPEDYQSQIDKQDKILTKHESEIEQNKLGIGTKVGYTEMNGTNKTLEKLLTEFSQTSSGFNFRIDSNGMIQDLTFDRNAFKLNSNLIEFNDGDVLIKDGRTTIKDAYIDKLFSKTAFIEQLKAVDIDLNRATITGGDNTNNIKLDHQSIMSYGTFTRSWGGETDTANLELGLYDGQMRMRNLDTGYRLYLTERGLSTSMEGAIDEFTSGTLEFHSQRFNPNSRGITMHSSYGAVAMVSDYSTAVIRSNLTANIESNEYSVYIRPYRLTRGGINDFRFWVKNGTNASATDGVLSFGNPNVRQASGIRFKKSTAGDPYVWITNGNGDYNTGVLHAMRYEGGSVDVNRFNMQHSYAFSNYGGGDVYMGTGGGEFIVTNNSHWRDGNPVYRNIRFGKWFAMSNERYKRDIKKWNTNVLELYRNDLQLYSYKIRDSENTELDLIEHGIVLRENSNEDEFPVEWRHKDGYNGNEITFWNTKAIQELAHENDTLKDRINYLENKLNRIMEMI